MEFYGSSLVLKVIDSIIRGRKNLTGGFRPLFFMEKGNFQLSVSFIRLHGPGGRSEPRHRIGGISGEGRNGCTQT